MSDSRAPPSDLPLAIFLQPACTAHKWIRTNNASHVYERPERVRAVMLGVCAGVARKEEEVRLNEQESKIGGQGGGSVNLEAAVEGLSSHGDPMPVSMDIKERRDRDPTPDIACLLGGMSLAPSHSDGAPPRSSDDVTITSTVVTASRPSDFIYLPPVAFSPSPLAYDAIPIPASIAPSISSASTTSSVPYSSPYLGSTERSSATNASYASPTRARTAALADARSRSTKSAPVPTVERHPSQVGLIIPIGSAQDPEAGEDEVVIPGELLTHHAATRTVHSAEPPIMPIPYHPTPSTVKSSAPSKLAPGVRMRQDSYGIPRSTYLPRLLHWSLRAPAMIRNGRCEIPKFFDDDEAWASMEGYKEESVVEGSGEMGSLTSARDTTSSPPLGVGTTGASLDPTSNTFLSARLKSSTPGKDKHGRSPGEDGYGMGEETTFNQGDLYLGPGSVAAIEGCIRTVCQAVDLVCGPAPEATRGGGESEDPLSGIGKTRTAALGSGEGSQLSGPSEVPIAESRVPNSSPGNPLSSHPHCKHAFCIIRPPGHHCGQDSPSGFCYINNVAVGAMHAYLSHDYDRAIILDFDLHHGNGTQSIVMGLNDATHVEELQQVAGKLAPPITEREMRLGRRRRGWKGFYGSLHDIWSYPCEDGDLDLIKDASVSLAGHGQHISNIHLEPYESESDFYARLYPHYLQLLEKAEGFVKATAADEQRTVVIISAGFDACQFEHQTMQRHDRRVPSSFFDRFTRDIVAFADKFAKGRVISVLEGGYSDRALASGAMSHVSGLLSPNLAQRGHWWDEPALQDLEKATKKKRMGGALAPIAMEASQIPHLKRTHELLGIFETWGVYEDRPIPTLPPRREGLRDRRKQLEDAESPASTAKRVLARPVKARSAHTTPVHQPATPPKVPFTEGKPVRRTRLRDDDDEVPGTQTPTQHHTPATPLVDTPMSDFQKALDKMSNMSMDEVRIHRGSETPIAEVGSSPLGSLAAGASWATLAIEQDPSMSVASTLRLSHEEQLVPERPRNLLKFRMPAEHENQDSAETEPPPVTPQAGLEDGEGASPAETNDKKILLKFKLPSLS